MDTVVSKGVMKEYRRLRDKGWQAKWAYVSAKTKDAWDTMNGFVFDGDDRALKQGPGETIYCPGPIRLILKADDCYDDSYINEWDNLSKKKKVIYRDALWDRIERDGVWCLVGEYWDGSEWVHADSCCSFIGDDWKDSGTDTDIMAMTISAYSDHLEAEARKWESDRPDMYKFGSVRTHEPQDLKEGDLVSISRDPEYPDCVTFHKI